MSRRTMSPKRMPDERGRRTARARIAQQATMGATAAVQYDEDGRVPV